MNTNCVCCAEHLVFRWTDTHGVAVCAYGCGLPYRVYHYEKDAEGVERRVDKPASPAVAEADVEVAKEFWSAHRSMVWPAQFDMGMRGGQTYSGATEDACDKFYTWLRAKHPHYFEPKRAETACEEPA